ncbi:MAG: type II toxin-antitoxin system HicA family toxin [Burkholderiales bacterium]
MSQKEKLLARLLSKPTDFTYHEARTLMGRFGFYEDKKGKTSGSRVAFVHSTSKVIVLLHKPHPGDILGLAGVEAIIDGLKANGDIS